MCVCLCVLGLYEVPLSMLGFGMGNYVVVKSSFKHAREKCESKRAYVF